jgi:hypothetical protein
MEYMNFLVLFILYVVAMEGLDQEHLNWRELIFIIYALGEMIAEIDLKRQLISAFSLDKLAAIREHGLKGESNYIRDSSRCSLQQFACKRLRSGIHDDIRCLLGR